LVDASIWFEPNPGADVTANNPQVPWTDEQWARVNQVIHEEASRARVAATFLPLVGPLPGGTDFVRAEIIPTDKPLRIQDRDTIQLATLQVKVELRGAQIADPEMRSVLAMFRRAANVLARLEDAVVFWGLDAPDASHKIVPKGGLTGIPDVWEIHGGEEARAGLWQPLGTPGWQWIPVANSGQALVAAVSNAVGQLEGHGHFGPFAVVLGQGLFLIAQTPDRDGYVLPQDRIIPFLGGGSLLRSSTLDGYSGYSGVVVALGGSPVELVVATDMSLQFLQVTDDPRYLFRVRERIALRIKEADAIVRLYFEPDPPTVTAVAPNHGPSAGGGNVIITGTNLLAATNVELDGTSATDFTVQSDIRIRMTLPPRGQNTPVKHVRVTTPGGTSAATQHDRFTYN
jgi:uncharacterized linocin/CFP29 family protein